MVKNNLRFKVVVGLGKTGLSCVRYLAKRGFNVAVVDSRMSPPGLEELRQNFPGVQLCLGEFDEKILAQADELILSPGVSKRESAIAACIQRGIKAIGDIELFARAATASIIAITGSNGKSTVTSLVGLMIEAAGNKVKVGGNLGVPALDLLDSETEFYVLELSSFQLETTCSLRPAAAVVLNISADHMDRYRSLDEYSAAKQRIYSDCQVAIINRDEPLSYANVSLPQKVISFGMDVPTKNNFGVAGNYLVYGTERLLSIAELKTKGLHNAANALASLALGTAINLPMAAMLHVLREFKGLPHRCQWIANINNVDWYNDSKGTNVGATKAAVEGLGYGSFGKIVLILGGIGKDADFSGLCDVVAKYARAVVLFGKDAVLIEQALLGASKMFRVISMAEVVAVCMREALPGDIVLLSPAAASFDMFNNFEHRGEVFVAEVEKIR
jgi:UDP-N-acetylmuramoylalanine--D-glutamate ligase